MAALRLMEPATLASGAMRHKRRPDGVRPARNFRPMWRRKCAGCEPCRICSRTDANFRDLICGPLRRGANRRPQASRGRPPNSAETIRRGRCACVPNPWARKRTGAGWWRLQRSAWTMSFKFRGSIADIPRQCTTRPRSPWPARNRGQHAPNSMTCWPPGERLFVGGKSEQVLKPLANLDCELPPAALGMPRPFCPTFATRSAATIDRKARNCRTFSSWHFHSPKGPVLTT